MPFPRAGEENQAVIFSMSDLTTHLSLESWICQILRIVKWLGKNLKESGQEDADGSWWVITIIVSILRVIGAGDKPWTGALPELVHSSESHWNSDGSREPHQASLLGELSPLKAIQREPWSLRSFFLPLSFYNHSQIWSQCSLPRGRGRAREWRGHACSFPG